MTYQNRHAVSPDLAEIRAMRRANAGFFRFFFQSNQEEAAGRILADILCSANAVAGNDFYETAFHSSLDLAGFRASGATPAGGTVVFLGSHEDRWTLTEADRKALRGLLLGASRIVLIGSGVFLPRDVGLGGAGALAIHPNFLGPMAEENPEQIIANGPVSLNGRVASAISQIAAQKLLIALIAQDHGTHTSQAVGHYIGLEERPVMSSVPSSAWKYIQKSSGDRLICSALKAMSNHIEEPLPISEIARIAGTSVRQIQRRFKQKTERSPQNVYREIRLQYAQNLISRSDLPVLDVALAAGFQNYATFYENFKRQYGASPTSMRQEQFFGSAATGVC